MTETRQGIKSPGKQGKIRVLQVITRLIPGGAADIVLHLCRELHDRGFHVHLAGAPHPEMLEEIYKAGVTYYPVPEFRREISPVNDIKAFIKVYNIIRRGGYQIVHTHTSKAGILGRFAARLARTPVIFHTPHGSLFHPTFFGPASLRFFALTERIAARWSDRITAICRSEVDDYLRYGIAPEDKYVIIRGIFIPDKFIQTQVNIKAKKRELGLPEDSFVIGIVARLSHEKGHYSALDTFKKIYKEIPDAFLLIVGDGEMDGAIRRRTALLGLEDRVIMTGYRRDIPEITRILDVSLTPSLWDCSPRSILEAMVCKVPVVATAVGGIPEMITHEESGLLVPRNDAEAMARSIIRLRNDGELAKKITEEAAHKANELFNPSQTIDRVIQLYQNHLADRGIRA